MGGTVNSIYQNLNYALNLQTEKLSNLQEQAATGSKINRSSDDPSTAYRVLGLNSQARTLDGYVETLSMTSSSLEISLTVVEDMISVLADTKANVSQILSGIYDQNSRASTAEQVDNTLEQLITLANMRHMNEYLFSGGDTDSAPYAVSRTDGKITSVTYQGSSENRLIEVASGVQSSAYYVGDEIFQSNSRGGLEFRGYTGAASGTGTSSVRGDTWLTVTGSAGNYNLSIDDGASTVNTDGTDTNLALTHSITGEVLYVDTTNISATGIDMVRAPGTYNVFETLIYVRDILNNEKNLSETQLSELRSASLESLEEVRSHLADKSVSIGSRIGFLEVLKESVENMKFGTEDETTMLQEADIAQIAIGLSRQEVLYQMSLNVAGSLMSMSLLDFLK
ncbi:MAG: flagellar hook-associated protein FlgL [Planctomycetota bacterium]|jgi:flagellar hook-associated protein 3 FlgL